MMSRSSSGKRFDVFEFAEEDEQVEKASQRFLGMFGNPKKPKPKPPSPLSKYTFLQCCKSSQHANTLSIKFVFVCNHTLCSFVVMVIIVVNVEKLCALWRVMTYVQFC